MKVQLPNFKNFLDRPRLLFWCAVVLFVLSTAMLSIALVTEHHDHQQFYRQANVLTPFKLGQTVRMGAASVSLTNPKYVSGSGSFTAPNGMKYLVVDLTVKNFSDSPIRVLPSTDTYVKDATGRVIYLTPYGLERPFHAGELLPGEQVSGQLSYLVPVSSRLKFYVDGVWSGGVLPIALTK